jgi:hypothetical protein
MGETIEQEVSRAISDAVAKHEGGFVVKWVALVESVDESGERGLWTMTSEDVKAWDTVGMLQHGLHLQMAQTLEGRS